MEPASAPELAELDAAALYIDIRRSSDITLAVGRTCTASLLRLFITAVAIAVNNRGGRVGSSQGDAILALFTGPCRAVRAVSAATEIGTFVAQTIRPTLRQYLSERPNPTNISIDFHMGMAVDMGPVQPVTVSAGDLIAALWVGQATNTAAHLANVDKRQRSYLMVTAEVHRELGETDNLAGTRQRWSSEQVLTVGGAVRRVRCIAMLADG